MMTLRDVAFAVGGVGGNRRQARFLEAPLPSEDGTKSKSPPLTSGVQRRAATAMKAFRCAADGMWFIVILGIIAGALGVMLMPTPAPAPTSKPMPAPAGSAVPPPAPRRFWISPQ
jgi:hypothetical protein